MRFPILAAAAATLAAASPAAALTLTVGDLDSGAVGGEPEDAAAPSADLVRVTNATGGRPVKNTDDPAVNENFATTFVLPGPVSAATLTFSVETISNFPATDAILLGFADAGDAVLADSVVYERTIGDDGGSPGLFAALLGDGTFDAGDVLADLSLDLSALPLAGGGTTDLIGAINAAGFLDVTLQDDHLVDYVRLEARAVPLPAPAALLLAAVAGLAAAARRR